MLRTMMHAKIHRATITEANLNYVGSITIDAALLEATGFCQMSGFKLSITIMEPDLKPMLLKGHMEVA